MVPIFLCLEDVFNVMWQWWSFVVYYIPRTCSSQIGENILGKTPNLQKRSLWYYQSEKVFCTYEM